MTLPVYLWLGPIAVHPHFIFEALSYIVGARVYMALKARRGDILAADDRWSVVAAAAVGAAVGSKVMYLLAEPGLTHAHISDIVYLMGGKSVVGGLVGALIAVEWTKRRIGVTRSTGDVFVIPLCVGIAIGRIGCFLTGLDDHTHGLPTSLPWAVDYGDGIPRHPAQLYEIGFLAILAMVCALISRRQSRCLTPPAWPPLPLGEGWGEGVSERERSAPGSASVSLVPAGAMSTPVIPAGSAAVGIAPAGTSGTLALPGGETLALPGAGRPRSEALLREGDLFKLFMVSYMAFRLLLEFIKPGEPIVGLNAIQWVALGVIGYYAYPFVVSALAPRNIWGAKTPTTGKTSG